MTNLNHLLYFRFKILNCFVLWSLTIVFLSFSTDALSKQNVKKYNIDPERSKIICSIRYSLIGTYRAEFDEFYGTISLDPKNIKAGHVMLNIRTDSVQSKYPVLDKIVRSNRLLDASRYPELTFDSHRLMADNKTNQWSVEGEFGLKDVKKILNLPFEIESIILAEDSSGELRAKGRWVINRKDFDVIWHPVLDKGGVIVANDVVVDWEVVAVE